MNITEIKVGDVVRFKRSAWDSRYSYMIVDAIDGDFLDGRRYHLGFRQAGHKRVVLYVGSGTVLAPLP